MAFGAFFSAIVLTPLWLQTSMGYTATWSGFTAAALGSLAVFIAPVVAKLSTKVDPRILVFSGVMWMGLLTLVRSYGITDMTQAQVAIPMLIQGIGMPFFFLPLMGLALSSVNVHEIASAAGLLNFIRTISGAFATSIVTTSWENETNSYRSDLVSILPLHSEITPPILDLLVQGQSVMLATNHIFLVSAVMLVFAALIIWLAPRPGQIADTSSVH